MTGRSADEGRWTGWGIPNGAAVSKQPTDPWAVVTRCRPHVGVDV